MKKIAIAIGIIIFLIFVGCFSYVLLTNNKEKEIPRVMIEEETANIDEYYVYGTNFNMKGNLEINDMTFKDIKLVLYNGEYQTVDLKYDNEIGKINFYISDVINDGLFLDDIAVGNYYLFLRLSYVNEEEDTYKYYSLKNNTKYSNTTYYTMSYVGNKITIDSNNDYPTLMYSVQKNNDTNICDIVIDPGHGGMDGGATALGYKETDFTLDLATNIKNELELLGLKVKLTHVEGQLGANDLLDEYNVGGRAIIPHEVNAKYLFSVHINKNAYNYVNGLEVYTASNINYDFARSLANNITSMTGLNFSNNKLYKIYDGVYTHNFSESEVASALQGYEQKNYNPYEVTTNSNYLYMIRETSGFMTGAYVDNRNQEKVGVNPYYDSNIGVESYLMELGYISNEDDVNRLKNNSDDYVKAIVKSIKDMLNV